MTAPVRFAPSVEHLLVPIGAVRPADTNPNSGDVDAIAESILVNGFRGAIIARRDTGEIVVGNHRYYALLGLGSKQIPVLYDDMSDAQAARLLIADNRTARLGRDDPALLVNMLDDLAEVAIGLAGTGFTDEDLERLHRLVEEPLHFTDDDPQEYARQRGAHQVITCPSCGHQWGPGVRTTPAGVDA